MLKVNIQDLKPGMTLAKTIFNSSGNVLLSGGMVLNTNFIQRLIELSIPAIFIRGDHLDDLEVPDVISEQLRVTAQKSVKDVFSGMQRYSRVDISAAKNLVNCMMDELIANRQVMINLTDIRAHEDYVFGHSVNVAVLSILTGISMSFNEIQLRNLGVGALLHDLGTVQIDKTILNKVSKLSPSEFEQYKNHTYYGFETLRAQTELSILSAHVAFQHHELLDGTGYPRGLKGSDIHEYSMIVAIADLYDELTTDYLQRKACHSHDAIRKIAGLAGIQYDLDITKAFLGNIAIYPIGSIVSLSTGEIAIVVDNRKNYPLSPVVRIILDSQHMKTEHREIDLAKDASVKILQLLNDISEVLPSIQEVCKRI
ncbi:MAG: HD-GYP domain-containing protein [Carboxydocellales bacterium]